MRSSQQMALVLRWLDLRYGCTCAATTAAASAAARSKASKRRSSHSVHSPLWPAATNALAAQTRALNSAAGTAATRPHVPKAAAPGSRANSAATSFAEQTAASADIANDTRPLQSLLAILADFVGAESASDLIRRLQPAAGPDRRQAAGAGETNGDAGRDGDVSLGVQAARAKDRIYNLSQDAWADERFRSRFTRASLHGLLGILLTKPDSGHLHMVSSTDRERALGILRLLRSHLPGDTQPLPASLSMRHKQRGWSTAEYEYLARANMGHISYDESMVIVHAVCQRRLPKSMQLWDTLLQGLVFAGDLAQAEAFIDNVAQVWHREPDESIMLTLFKAYVQAGQADQARRVFRAMSDKWWPLSRKTYTAMLQLYTKLLQTQTLLLKSGNGQPTATIVEPDLETGRPRNTRATMYSELRRGLIVGEAKAFLKELATLQMRKDATMYASLIHLHCSLGHIGEALKLLDEMEADADLGGKPRAEVYGMLLHSAVVRLRKPRESHLQPRPGLLGDLASGDNRAHQLAQTAMTVMSRMQDRGLSPSIEMYTILLSAMMRIGDDHNAVRIIELVLDQSDQEQGDPDGLRPDLRFYKLCTEWAKSKGMHSTVSRLQVHAVSHRIDLDPQPHE
ncbi:hypothetical protein BC831DRAFT_465240 [Entophlyctis helioformis]|nr:hypothetical protein BC831DRAFT_465240 [Entophlyctis helioformis]